MVLFSAFVIYELTEAFAYQMHKQAMHKQVENSHACALWQDLRPASCTSIISRSLHSCKPEQNQASAQAGPKYIWALSCWTSPITPKHEPRLSGPQMVRRHDRA